MKPEEKQRDLRASIEIRIRELAVKVLAFWTLLDFHFCGGIRRTPIWLHVWDDYLKWAALHLKHPRFFSHTEENVGPNRWEL